MQDGHPPTQWEWEKGSRHLSGKWVLSPKNDPVAIRDLVRTQRREVSVLRVTPIPDSYLLNQSFSYKDLRFLP